MKFGLKLQGTETKLLGAAFDFALEVVLRHERVKASRAGEAIRVGSNCAGDLFVRSSIILDDGVRDDERTLDPEPIHRSQQLVCGEAPPAVSGNTDVSVGVEDFEIVFHGRPTSAVPCASWPEPFRRKPRMDTNPRENDVFLRVVASSLGHE